MFVVYGYFQWKKILVMAREDSKKVIVLPAGVSLNKKQRLDLEKLFHRNRKNLKTVECLLWL